MGTRSSAVSVLVALVACAALASMVSPRTVLANDSSIGATGGAVYPVWNTDVRLAAETVQATVFGSFAEYRIDFRFVNEGTGQTVKLGFPFTDTIAVGEGGTSRPIGFQAWQDGEPLSVRAVAARYKQGESTAGYFVHEAYFPRGATTITVSYLAQDSATAISRRRGVGWDEPGFGYAQWHQYWLHTGSTWKGTIGEAVVRYRLAASFPGQDIELSAADANKDVPVTSPPGWAKPLPRSYQWHFIDFEPTPGPEAGWWGQQSDYDVTLGFMVGEGRPLSPQAEWTWSSLAGEAWSERHSGNLQDGGVATTWVEGAPGPGVGEWVEARFERPTRLRELRIVPGNNEYVSAFTKYARPRTLKAVFSDGTSSVLRLRDAPSLQRFPVDVTTDSVRLLIESVYEGSDYPAACISEVEFGTEKAPGYASFRQLIDDPSATGRLSAWAGPAAPMPSTASRFVEWREEQDADLANGGDLIGIDAYRAFPADEAPYKEPASLAVIEREHSTLTLPDEELVGTATAVNALSYWTYEIRYSSGMDLLVNTDLSRVPNRSVLAELVDESRNAEPYQDGRRLPFDARAIGDCVVGVARAGTLECCCCCDGEDPANIPGQVFWRDGDHSYHLYARSDEVTIDQLVEVATFLIDPSLLQSAEAADSRAHRTSRAWLVTVAAVGTAAAAFLLVARRRKVAAQPTDG